MKKLLLYAFMLINFHVLAKDMTLQGTIGSYPIAMTISIEDDGTCNGRYFYNSNIHDIYFEGTAMKNVLVFTAKAEGRDADQQETFTLTLGDKDNISGTWKNRKGKTMPVSLHTADISAITNPFLGLSSIGDDPYEYIRTSEMKIIQDSVAKKGPYTLKYIHIDHSTAGLVQFTAGPNMPVWKKINKDLENKLLYYALQDFSCEVDKYYFTPVIIKNGVFSTNVFSSLYCNGTAHPDFDNDPVNIDLRTGKTLKLEDVMLLTDVPAPEAQAHYGPWTDFQEHFFAPKLIELLTRLYPAHMQTPVASNTSCNYSDVQVWKFAQWYLTDKGMYILPDFPHAQGPCRDPEWCIIPFDEIRKHPNTSSGIIFSD